MCVIILNWNGGVETLQCVKSVLSSSYPNLAVLVVDNGSEDNSIDLLAGESSISVLTNGRNLGYAGGNNRGLRWCQSRDFEYMMILNNDTLVDPGLVAELASYLDQNPDVGVVGPSIMLWKSPRTHQFQRHTYITSPTEDDAISGCCFMIRRQVLDTVGLLDAQFFIYWEERDYFSRAKLKGCRVVYLPTTNKVFHKVESATSKDLVTFDYYRYRNGFLYYRRYARSPLRPLFHLVAATSAALRRSISLPHTIAIARAIADGFRLFVANPPVRESL